MRNHRSMAGRRTTPRLTPAEEPVSGWRRLATRAALPGYLRRRNHRRGFAYARLFPGGEQADMVFTDPSLQRRLRQQCQGLDGKTPPHPQRCQRRVPSTSCGRRWTLLIAHPRRDLRCHVLQQSRHPCKRPSALPVASGRPSSSGPQHLHAGRARTTSASTSRSLYGWSEGATRHGVATATRATRLADQEASEERSAPDHEAGGTGRAGYIRNSSRLR